MGHPLTWRGAGGVCWLVCCWALHCGQVAAEPFPGYETAYAINADVNASRVYTERLAKYYRPWRVIERGEPGNCLDYAVLKCAELRKAGFSSDRLELLAFTQWNGEGHALCVIDGKWGMDWKARPVLATRSALDARSELVPVHVTAPWR